MKRTALVLWALACAPVPLFAQKDHSRVADSNGYRPIGLASAPHAAPAAPAPRGPGAWQPLGPFGGDAEDVAVSPTDPTIVLAGIAPAGGTGGALYRSTDSGATWTTVPSIGARSVYDIAFTSTGTVWVGTDDSVWVSTDNGATFTQSSLNIGLNDQTFAVEVDPNDPMVIWAGVADALGNQTQNVLKSTNGGASWTNVTPPEAAGVSCADIAINPSNSDEVMVTFAGAFGGGSVYYTDNGGVSWTNVTGILPNRPIRAVRYVNGAWLIGGGQLFGSQFFGIWRSTNNGKSWDQLDDASWPRSVCNAIAVDPADPNVILAATPDGIHKSTNGGADWTIASGGTAPFAVNSVRFAPGSSSRVVIGASSFGVVLSDDAVETSRVSSVGIGALDVYSVAANPNNTDELAVAFQGLNNGGVYASTDGGQTWQVQNCPGTRYNCVRFAPDGTLYAISDGPVGLAQEGVYRRNPDDSWTLLGPFQGNLFESELYFLDFGQVDPDLFFVSGNDFGVAGFEATIWRSPNAGTDWFKVYESPMGQSAYAFDVHVVRDGTDEIVLAALQSFTTDPPGLNGVFRSTNSGESFERVSGTGLPETLWGYDLEPDPTNPNRIYVANGAFSGGGIWVSDDAGANWAPFTSGFNTRGIAVDPTNPDSLYFWAVSAPFPVYNVTDNGASITPASEGLAGGPRQIVAVGGSEPRILLATSIGVYQLSLEAPCLADFNGDGTVNSQDFFDFLTAFFAEQREADFNGDGTINSQDFFDFLTEFFVGCP